MENIKTGINGKHNGDRIQTVNQYVKGRLVCGGVLCHSAPMYLSAYYPNAER